MPAGSSVEERKAAPTSIVLAVFALGFLFSFFLLQNLPFTFGDDLNVIHVAKSTSWRFLVKEILNPWTPAWYVHGAESLLTTRVFETFLFKGIHALFGYDSNAFFALKCLGYAGCGSFIFLLLFWATQCRWNALGGSLFFYLLPPVYRSISWIADLEIVAQMSVLVAFTLFLRIYHSEKESFFRSLIKSAVLIASAWLGMKVKETARIIPFVLLGFIVLHQNWRLPSWARKPKNLLLLASAVGLLISVVPWRKAASLSLDARSDVAIFKVDFSPWMSIMPTLLGLVGMLFLFGLAAWITARFLGFSRGENSEVSLNPPISPFAKGGDLVKPRVAARPGRPDPSDRGVRGILPFVDIGGAGIFLFLLLWSGACLAGFALNLSIQGNVRYLTTLLIPLTVLGFTLYARAVALVQGKSKLLLNILFAVFFVVSLQRNLDEVIFMRNFHSGFDIADYLLTKKIYEDRFQDADVSWSELDDFYRGKGLAKPGEFHEIRIKEWDENKKADAEVSNLAKVASKWGTAYVLSFNQGLYAGEGKVKRIYHANTANQSLYSAVIGKLKKKSHRKIALYKYEP